MLRIACFLLLPVSVSCLGSLSCVTQADPDHDPQNDDPAYDNVVVTIKHEYKSVTNGRPYTDTRNTNTVSMGVPGDSATLSLVDNKKNHHELSVGFNSTHVCAAVDYLAEGEACIEYGCTNTEPTYECRSVCFPARGINKYKLDFYKSIQHILGIGTVITQDYFEISVSGNVRRQCYELESRTYSPNGNIPISECPVGQRCRVTSAWVSRRSDPRYYIGCEENSKHLDGCEKTGCQFNVREPIPESGTPFKWYKICRECCDEDLCNVVI